MSSTLRRSVDFLQALPALPKIAKEILAIEMASDKANEKLLKLINKDPAISARLIGLANSPLFGTSRRIMTVNEAATVLGIKRVKMIALSFAMISSLPKKSGGALDQTRLWMHSMAVALAMDALSKAMPAALRPSDEEIYLAGLLHDIGFLVLEFVDPELSTRFHERLASEGWLDAELEAEMLEMDHGELGALLAEHWGLGETIAAVLRFHHRGETGSDGFGQPLVAMAYLAERVLPTFGSEPKATDAEKWRLVGISPERVEEVEALMRARGEEIASAIS